MDFAITDDSVHGFDFKKAKSIKNIEGLIYASNQSGCLVGYLAGEMTKAKGGKQVIGAVGGIEIPAVDDYIVGYNYCAKIADPGIKVLVNYSNDFVAQDKCKTVAQNQIGQGSQVEFQVAGGCGLGALNAAADAGIWGIGVDVDQYSLAKNVLTSALKRVDNGIFAAIQQAQSGKFKGGSDLLFDMKNDGVGVGRISPKVPKADITAMNALKAKLIAGKVKVPVAKGSDLLGSPGAHVGRRRGNTIDEGRAPARPLRFSGLESSDGGGARPRAAGNHKELSGDRRQRPCRLRSAARRGACAARRERRRQVDADEHPVRAVPARRGRDPRRRQARHASARRATRSAGHRDGPPALHADPGDDRRREHRSRDRAARTASSSTSAAPSGACASSRSSSGSPSTRRALVCDITVGQQQRVEILKALYRGAEILILDEPTAVLTPQEARRALRDHPQPEGGRQVDHLHQPQAERGARDRRPDHGAAARQERSTPCPREGATEEALARMMVGREVLLRVEKAPAQPGDVLLSSRGPARRRRPRLEKVRGVSFDVRAGEIVGIAGVDGNGQTELIEAITGLRKIESAPITVAGSELARRATRARCSTRASATFPKTGSAAGSCSSSPSPRTSRCTTTPKPPDSRCGWLFPARLVERAARLIKEFDVRGGGPLTRAGALSGGNQQKVVVAREIERDPAVLIAAQPTRGLDVGAIEYVHRRLVAERDDGRAILLVSLELDEILSLADRILVIYEGEIVGEHSGDVSRGADRPRDARRTGAGRPHERDRPDAPRAANARGGGRRPARSSRASRHSAPAVSSFRLTAVSRS